MSWFSTNYEKAALGGAAVIALGAAYMGWSQLKAVDEDFGLTLKGQGDNNAAVDGAERIPKAMQSMELDHSWVRGRDGNRPVDLFTGIALFVQRSAPTQAIDLLKGQEVHPGIPNSFWLDNRIDPGFADSPQRDPDEDGFNNREEYLAKTDPTDSKSHPLLISKLRYLKDESLAWVLRPGYGTTDGEFPFTYEDGKRRQNKMGAGSMVATGALFFADEPMQGRFKLLGHEEREEMNEKINLTMKVTYVKIEDQKPNKKGTIYEFPAPLSRAQTPNHTKYDRSAVLSLDALGLEGQEFVIEENTAFSLPPGGDKKDYLLKEVSPQSITVEYPASDGTRKSVQITQGNTPSL